MEELVRPTERSTNSGRGVDLDGRDLAQVAAPFLPQLALCAGLLRHATGIVSATCLPFLRTDEVYEPVADADADADAVAAWPPAIALMLGLALTPCRNVRINSISGESGLRVPAQARRVGRCARYDVSPDVIDGLP